MTKYIIGEFFNSGGATLYKNSSDQTVLINTTEMVEIHIWKYIAIIASNQTMHFQITLVCYDFQI